MADEITVSSADAMFMGVSEEFGGGTRNAQKKWNTVVNEIQRKPKEGKADTSLVKQIQGELRRELRFVSHPRWWWAFFTLN